MVLLALLLVQSASAESGGGAYRAAFDKAFRASFRTRSIERCRAKASTAAEAKIDVTPICACVTDRLLATKTVEELQGQPSNLEVQPIIKACIAANPPVTGSAK